MKIKPLAMIENEPTRESDIAKMVKKINEIVNALNTLLEQ